MARKNKQAAGRAPQPEPAAVVEATRRPEWWGKFLLELVYTSSVPMAAAAAGVTRQSAHELLNTYPELKAEADEAKLIRQATIRKVLLEIGTKGILLPVYDLAGNQVGETRKWSPQVLLALTAELPEYQRAANAPNAKPSEDRPALTDADADRIVAALARHVAARQALPAVADG